MRAVRFTIEYAVPSESWLEAQDLAKEHLTYDLETRNLCENDFVVEVD